MLMEKTDWPEKRRQRMQDLRGDAVVSRGVPLIDQVVVPQDEREEG
jgi:hypothetical protein